MPGKGMNSDEDLTEACRSDDLAIPHSPNGRKSVRRTNPHFGARLRVTSPPSSALSGFCFHSRLRSSIIPLPYEAHSSPGHGCFLRCRRRKTETRNCGENPSSSEEVATRRAAGSYPPPPTKRESTASTRPCRSGRPTASVPTPSSFPSIMTSTCATRHFSRRCSSRFSAAMEDVGIDEAYLDISEHRPSRRGDRPRDQAADPRRDGTHLFDRDRPQQAAGQDRLGHAETRRTDDPGRGRRASPDLAHARQKAPGRGTQDGGSPEGAWESTRSGRLPP